MKASSVTIFVLTALLLGTACSDSQAPAESEPTAETPKQVEVAGPQTSETEGPRGDIEESLSTLDDLLPEQFVGITVPWSGDLDGMSERRIIRTLVVSGGPQFFYHAGKPRGMVAELLVILQAEINTGLDRGLDQVEILPMPVSRDRLIPALLSGQADLVAADLTITDARSELVDFSTPLAKNINEIVVFSPGRGEDVTSLDDLSGTTVYIRRSSSYFEHLVGLNRDLISRGLEPVRIDEANEFLRAQDILEMVNAGLVTATVIDSYKASYWSTIFPDMQIRDDLIIHTGGEIAWTFRKDSPKLAAAINDFVRGHRQGTLIGNVLINRYMENLDWVRNSTSESGIDRLRLLLQHFRSSGEESDLDPLMLAAQAYQESELDNDRESPVGALGIMQIKPSTAADRNVGINDISSPADNIRAGARYMRFLMDRYFSDPEMGEVQRWLFALAAYNAGPARIRRLREQAAAEGHDPNIWLDNVELIAARKIGRETVRYVRKVFKYYVAYRMAWNASALRQSLDEN